MVRRTTLVALVAFGCAGPEATADKRSGSAEPPPVPASVPAGPKAKPITTRAPLRGPVDALLSRHVAPLVRGDDAVNFVSIGVFAGGREYYAGYSQEGSRFRPGPDSQFHVASLTKPHTALLAATAIVAGQLELDGAVADCRHHPVTAFCARGKTSLRHLLSHSAGLRPVPKDARGDEYDQAKLRRYLAGTKPPAAPGKAFVYSTLGYGAVALVVQDKLGRDFAELLRERVLRPIGSGAVFRPRDATKLAPGHRRGRRAEAAPTRQAFVASGGLIASARDLLRLVAVNADSSRIPALRKAIEVTHEINWDLRGFRGAAVALGWQVDRERRYYWHPGVSSVHRSAMAFDPRSQTGVVILAGQHMALSDYRLEDAAFAVLDGLASAAKGKGAGR